MGRKRGPTMSAAERQRIYRARRDADVQRRQQYLETERDRWRKDVVTGKKMLQRDRSESGQCVQREKWREVHERRKARKTLLEDRDSSRGGLGGALAPSGGDSGAEEGFNTSPTSPKSPTTPEIKVEADILVWAESPERTLAPSGGDLPRFKPPSSQAQFTDFYVNRNSLAPVLSSQSPHSPLSAPSHNFLEPSLLEEGFNTSPTSPKGPTTPEIIVEADILVRAESPERTLAPSGGDLPRPKPPSSQAHLTDFYVNRNSLAPVLSSQSPHSPPSAPSHNFPEPSLLEEGFNTSPSSPKSPAIPEIKVEADILVRAESPESTSSSQPGTSRQHDIGKKRGPPMSTTERQRIYRARRDADAQRRQQYLVTERDRWRRRKEAGKKILQKYRSESGQCAQRKKWREVHERRKARKTLLENRGGSGGLGRSLAPSGGGLPPPKPPYPQTQLTDFYVNLNSLAPALNSQPPHSPPSHHFLEPSLLEEEFNTSPTSPETPVTPEIKVEADILESSSSSQPGTSRQHDIGRKRGLPMSVAEKQRLYRARRDADAQKRQQYLETERDRWRKGVEAGKKILQKDRSESGQCAQRKKWREVHERRKARKTLHEEGFSPSSQPGTSRQHDIGSRRRWAGQNKSKRKQQDNQDQINFLYNLEKGDQGSTAYMTLTLL